MEEDDPMVSCPFDSAHRHLRSRMPYHQLRCTKNDPRKHLFENKRQCAFDATHHVAKEDYEKHVLQECEAARRILNTNNLDEEDETGPNILPVNPNADLSTEDWGDGAWENEATQSGYDPQKANQDRAIIQNQIGLFRVQRRQHRNQQRRRINQLNHDGANSSNNQ